MNKLMSIAALSCAIPVAGAMGQGMLGTTLHFEHLFPDLSSNVASSDVVITNSVEVVGLFGAFTYDVTDTQLIVTNPSPNVGWTGADFNGPLFTDTTNNLPAIVNVTLDPSTSWVGFDSSRIYWTADSFGVNMQGLWGGPDQQIVLNITFAPAPGAAAALGLGGLAAIRRRRR